jgi:hypothetical protein
MSWPIRSPYPSRWPQRFRPTVERLEDRLTPSGLFTVLNTDDSGLGSLRQAILDSNAAVGGINTIQFAIPGSGVHTINLLTGLETLTQAVVIDGYTEAGSQPNTLAVGDNAVLTIQIDGSVAGANTCLGISTGGCTVRGLVINRFFYYAFLLSGPSATGNTIAGNFLGTDPTGTTVPGGTRGGVGVYGGASNNTIGGTSPDARNIISGHQFNGVILADPSTDGNIVAGNYIGTDASGTVGLGNLGQGVLIDNGASNNMIGGGTPGAANVISGNQLSGIEIQDAGTSGNLVVGNFIGTDATGTAALGNGGDGVDLQGGASTNTIGSDLKDAPPNVISGNLGQGIEIAGAGTDGNQVEHDYIGTDVTGTARLGNSDNGVRIDQGASQNAIHGNLVSGNGEGGVKIADNGTSDNVVQQNLIGTDATGTAALGNHEVGVHVMDFASGNLIGGISIPADLLAHHFDKVAGNLISGNRLGVLLTNGAFANLVEGNGIGVDTSGRAALPNTGEFGIGVGNAPNNTIGGTQPGAGNVIAGNLRGGVGITGSASMGNLVEGNRIGVDINGSPLGNGADGVFLGRFITDDGSQFDSPSDNTIGGTTDGTSNEIAFNAGNGVTVLSGTGNAILRNAIFANSRLGIDLGDDGVTLNGTHSGSAGPNNWQAFPDLTQTTDAGGRQIVSGSLRSTPNTTFRIEFFANAVPDPSGYGQGQVYLGFVTVTTDASGVAAIRFTYGLDLADRFVTSTATDPSGNTSEFSRAITVGATVNPANLVLMPGPQPRLTGASLSAPTEAFVPPEESAPETALAVSDPIPESGKSESGSSQQPKSDVDVLPLTPEMTTATGAAALLSANANPVWPACVNILQRALWATYGQSGSSSSMPDGRGLEDSVPSKALQITSAILDSNDSVAMVEELWSRSAKASQGGKQPVVGQRAAQPAALQTAGERGAQGPDALPPEAARRSSFAWRWWVPVLVTATAAGATALFWRRSRPEWAAKRTSVASREPLRK